MITVSVEEAEGFYETPLSFIVYDTRKYQGVWLTRAEAEQVVAELQKALEEGEG